MGRRLYGRPRHHRHPQRVPDTPRSISPTRITGRSSRKSGRATSAAAIISPSPAPMTHLERAREAVPARSYGVRFLLRQRDHRAGQRGVARAVLSDHLATQRREPGRRGAGRAPRLSSRLPVSGGDRALSRPRPASLAGADAARRDRPLRHADRTGWTLDLPFSQGYLPGYMATARPEFRDYFDKHHVQLPLTKGDAVFFNPALFHAAGTNRSKDVRRIANLLQVSSAFGRAMENVDRLKMSLKLYPALKDLERSGDQCGRRRQRHRGLRGGLFLPDQSGSRPAERRPGAKTQQDLMRQALKEIGRRTCSAKRLKRSPSGS